MTGRARIHTLIICIGAVLCTVLGTAAAAAHKPDGWVLTDEQATGIPAGINSGGDVLLLDPKNDSYRLLRADGARLDLNVPELFSDLIVVGPNDAGTTAASYEKNSGKTVAGTFDRSGHFTAMADPEHAAVVDINDNGVVIGATSAGGHRHIVHWTRHGDPYDVDTGTRAVNPTSVNDHGQIAAWIEGNPGPAGRRGAVFNRNGHLLRYLHRFPGEDFDLPGEINDNGVVIGYAYVSDPNGGPHTSVPLRWGNLGRPHRFIAPDGAVRAVVESINDHHLMGGFVSYPDPNGGAGLVDVPAVWTSARTVELLADPPSSTPPGEPATSDVEVYELNNGNVLAGSAARSDYAELVIWQPTG